MTNPRNPTTLLPTHWLRARAAQSAFINLENRRGSLDARGQPPRSDMSARDARAMTKMREGVCSREPGGERRTLHPHGTAKCGALKLRASNAGVTGATSTVALDDADGGGMLGIGHDRAAYANLHGE